MCWTKQLKRRITKGTEDISQARKHKWRTKHKKIQTSLATKELKSRWDTISHSIEWQKIKILRTPSIGRTALKGNFHFPLVGACELLPSLWETVYYYVVKLNTYLFKVIIHASWPETVLLSALNILPCRKLLRSRQTGMMGRLSISHPNNPFLSMWPWETPARAPGDI